MSPSWYYYSLFCAIFVNTGPRFYPWSLQLWFTCRTWTFSELPPQSFHHCPASDSSDIIFFFGNVFARLHLVYLSVYVCAHCFWGTYCSLPTEHERVRESEFWFVTDLLRVGLLDLAAGEMRIRKSLMEKTLWGKKRSVAWKQQFLYLGLVILSLCLCDSELFDLKFNLCTYVVFVCFCAFWRRREPSRGRPSSAPSPAKGIWT